jgi:Spy/CpxP family protein refolding chaperone
MFLSTSIVQGQSPTVLPQDAQRQAGDLIRQLQQQQGGGGRGAAPGGSILFKSADGRAFVWNPGAWWTNPNLVTRLGLTDDQKSKIEKVFENHRQSLSDESAQLDKQESQLAALLAADPVDHNAVLSQIDRVTQARADLERSNSAMTLEMREVLSSAQWQQLQSQPRWLNNDVGTFRLYNPSILAPGGQRSSGQRGGQRQQ